MKTPKCKICCIIQTMWKEVKGYPNYCVSKKGQIINLNNSRVIMGTITKQGYVRVQLHRKGEATRSVFLHRLVADAFLKKDKGKTQVNHKDGDKTNNDVSNLEWVTCSENCLHRERVLGVERSYKNRHRKKVLCVETGQAYESALDAARQTGLRQGNISAVARGKQKTCGGFIWRYV